MTDVWTVAIDGRIAHVADTLATAKSICADYLKRCEPSAVCHGDWADLSAAKDGSIWATYFTANRWRNGRMTATLIEMRVTRTRISTTGEWIEGDRS